MPGVAVGLKPRSAPLRRPIFVHSKYHRTSLQISLRTTTLSALLTVSTLLLPAPLYLLLLPCYSTNDLGDVVVFSADVVDIMFASRYFALGADLDVKECTLAQVSFRDRTRVMNNLCEVQEARVGRGVGSFCNVCGCWAVALGHVSEKGAGP